MCGTWLIHVWDMMHLYLWHDSCIRMIRLSHMCETTLSRLTHSTLSFDLLIWPTHPTRSFDSLVRLTPSFDSLIRLTHPTHPFDSLIYSSNSLIRLIHMCEMNRSKCDMTHSLVWHDASMCRTWCIYVCDMTHSCMWHENIIRILQLIHMCDILRWYVCYDSSICVDTCDMFMHASLWIHMGWLHLVGSFKIWVSFAKEPYKRDPVLQKRPIILRSLRIEATPYALYDSFICVTSRVDVCAMTHPSVCHDSFICVTWRIRTHYTTHLCVYHFTLICVPWLIHMCDSTHSYVWRDPYAWHDSFICVTFCIDRCAMTHPYLWHDSSICVTWIICVTWVIGACDMTHWMCAITHPWVCHICGMTQPYVCHHSSIFVTRLIYTRTMTHS